jgi:hypothetical protein
VKALRYLSIVLRQLDEGGYRFFLFLDKAKNICKSVEIAK